jgi:hypothetical protein
MKTVQFPPLCPFGDSVDDGVVLRRPSSRTVIWQMTANHFMRVNLYEDGEVTYYLGTRKKVQDDLLESIDGIEDCVTVDDFDEGASDMLRRFKFNRLLKALNKN